MRSLNVLEWHLSVSHELPSALALLTTKLLESMVEVVAEGGHRRVVGWLRRRVAWPISRALVVEAGAGQIAQVG